MKSQITTFLIFIFLLTGCIGEFTQQKGMKSTGVWGPLEIKSELVPDLIIIPDKSEQIELTGNYFDVNRGLLFFEKPLTPGKGYQLASKESPENIIEKISVREPCIIFIGNPATNPELWVDCKNEESIKLTHTNGKVTGFSTGLSGDYIFFASINESGGTNIYTTSRDGKSTKIVFSCGANTCSELDFDEKANLLVFHESGNVSYVHITDTQGKIHFSYPTRAIEMEFSPNGNFVSFLDPDTQTLKLLSSTNGSVKKVELSAEGLIGGWSQDSQKILYGSINYWGGIPGTSIFEYDVEKDQNRLVLQNQSQDLEFYAPIYLANPNEYLVSVRQRKSGASKQFWIVGADHVSGKICENAQYFCTQPSWNFNYSQLLFQKYPANLSSGTPQVVVWDRSSEKELIVSADGAMPKWLF